MDSIEEVTFPDRKHHTFYSRLVCIEKPTLHILPSSIKTQNDLAQLQPNYLLKD